jgi:hypothetical protein
MHGFLQMARAGSQALGMTVNHVQWGAEPLMHHGGYASAEPGKQP